MKTLGFTAEIKQLLDLVIHSIYSNKEIFLRELISNSSDAIDKLRLINLSSSNAFIDSNFQITVSVDKENKFITIEDNGIGMNKEDCINNLGTIAKSGTKEFINAIKEANEQAKTGLIGQFGVGFYSAFMISSRITVISKRYDEDTICVWSSDGSDTYSIEDFDKENLSEFESRFGDKYSIHFDLHNDAHHEHGSSCNHKTHGTKIILEVKDEDKDFLDQFRIKNIIKTYSDNISYPIFYYDKYSQNSARVNSTTAIWLKSKSEITEDEYKTFYKDISQDPNPYVGILHNRNEGKVEFINLLYIPSKKSHDTYHPDRLSKIKLYINRVFIADTKVNLVPKYLRFLRGIVDCPSLPLNISREMLQDNPMLQVISESLEKKSLSKFNEIKNQNIEGYNNFWENFGPVIKEGLCEYTSKHEEILKICLFYSVKQKKMISLDEYITSIESENIAASDGQVIEKKIYYMLGEENSDLDFLCKSSHIEGLISENKDVLIMTDPVDSFWVTIVTKYKDYEFISATKSDSLSSKESNENKTELCKHFEEVLAQYNVTVKISNSMKSSYARLVDDGMMSMSMEKFLLKNNQKLNQPIKKVMEINENHPYIQKIKGLYENHQPIADDLIKMTFFKVCIAENYNIDKLEFNNVLDKITNLIN